jgi:alkylation response protein AidB-like acyl-CoA dehydrogenase
MTFGDGKPARGLLVGNVHDGHQADVPRHRARAHGVGVKSMATLSTAYLNASRLREGPRAGPRPHERARQEREEVAIIRHADVRRMLMQQKSHAEGMRAMILFAASLQDEVEIQGGGHHDERAAGSTR